MQIVKVSPKGQITIPKEVRKMSKSKSYALKMSGKTIILHPIEIRIIKDDTEDFSALSAKSFEFWEDEKDDVYQKFYEGKK